VLFGMEEFAGFLRFGESEPAPWIEPAHDGEKLMMLREEDFGNVIGELDRYVETWRDLVACSAPLQRLRSYRVLNVVRRVQKDELPAAWREDELKKASWATAAVCFLGFHDGRELHHYEWARRRMLPGPSGEWLTAYTDPEIADAVQRDRDEGGRAWMNAFQNAPTVQSWLRQLMYLYRGDAEWLREGPSSDLSSRAADGAGQEAYDQSLVLAMLLTSRFAVSR